MSGDLWLCPATGVGSKIYMEDEIRGGSGTMIGGWNRPRVWMPIAVFVVVVVGCGEQMSSPTTDSPVAATAASTPDSPDSATAAGRADNGDVDRFFIEADVIHLSLVRAQNAVGPSRDLSSGKFTIAPDLPHEELELLAGTIPAGLPVDVEHRLLLVYWNLYARTVGLARATSRELDAEGQQGCFEGVSSNRELFGGYLDEARTATVGLSEPAVPRNSAAGGTLAARLELIEVANGGCLSCGIDMADPGPRELDPAVPIPVDWGAQEIDGIPLVEAEFVDGEWLIVLNAC